MSVLYEIIINIYGFVIFLVSFFNKKAKKWINGRKNIFRNLKKDFENLENPILWFHASSLGEFEQGRPLIEKIRSCYHHYKILLTFFSPSGYEIRKNYQGADFVYYLPLDTRCNARKFLKIVKPEKIFFIKYEFWYNYLSLAYKYNIPVYLVSGIFRENQLFFRWYGNFYRKFLKFFNTFFVQDEKSYNLLKQIGFQNIVISGDTRFDRVFTIAKNSKEIDIARNFCNDKFTIVCGSTWPEDEKIIIDFINKSKIDLKFIIAPHEITNSHIKNIINSLKKPYILFSETEKIIRHLNDYCVLIIDNIGMLSSLYKYGKIAYVGGGFGMGIHNVLEAVVYGIPAIFGPNYKKFKEAVDLINAKGAFSINDYKSFENTIYLFYNNHEILKESGNIAQEYVKNNIGATDKIVNYIFKSF